MEKQDLWKSIVGELEVTSASSYISAFLPKTNLGNIDSVNKTFEIIFPNNLSRDNIKNKLGEKIELLVKERLGEKYQILYSISKDSIEKPKYTSNAPLFSNNFERINEIKESPINFESHLLKEYSFDNYIVGPNNQLAYSVARAIAENPGVSYNPFLIYSGVGLGKTHLLQAIGNEIVKNFPEKKVLYTTSQDFLNDLMDALQHRRNKGGTLREFKNKYIKIDVWLIDDVQLIAGRDTTQDEFYFAFNTLYLNKKQIVLTTDRHPSEIKKLEERIKSRFKMGMIADMQSPDIDVRCAILRAKRDLMEAKIDNETIDYIAQRVFGSIRELEGAFLQVVTQAKINNEICDINCAKRVLEKSLVQEQEKNIKPVKIVQEISKFYNIEIREIKGPKRDKNLVYSRHISMYLLKEIARLPLITIGEILGGRDHTTIMHGIQKIENEISNKNYKLIKEISIIKQSIFGEIV